MRPACLARFRSLIWAALTVLLIALSALSAPAQTTTAASDAQADELVARAQTTLATLQPLLETQSTLQEQATALAARIEAASEVEKPALSEEYEALGAELDAVTDQISIVVTGISEREYSASEDTQFDLRREFENLVEPFVSLLIGATQDARRIERARRELATAQARLRDAEIALLNIDAALALTDDPTLTETLRTRRTLWQERQVQTQSRADALTQQLLDMTSERTTPASKVQSALKGFVQERGLSLLLGAGAFFGILILCRLIAAIFNRAVSSNGKPRSFAVRLTQLLFWVFSLLASFAGLLVIFNLRNDWLLLGLTTILLVALVWVCIRMLPSLLEQVTVLLNMGAVQEDERVLFGGVPFRVHKLGLYTDLVNPALDGGEFTLPVRELVGLHSRPAAANEAWFPSEKGDWVRLSDGNSGQVIAQTPEMVVVRLLGGAHVTYQTGDYLAQTPENLSHGFRIEIEFGIAYRHQTDATDTIIHTLRTEVKAHMITFVGADKLRAVSVEFLRAGASSLDYEIELDVTGAAAPRFEEIERELARILVEIATRHDWEIPFQQIVLHQAG